MHSTSHKWFLLSSPNVLHEIRSSIVNTMNVLELYRWTICSNFSLCLLFMSHGSNNGPMSDHYLLACVHFVLSMGYKWMLHCGHHKYTCSLLCKCELGIFLSVFLHDGFIVENLWNNNMIGEFRFWQSLKQHVFIVVLVKANIFSKKILIR